MLVDITFSDSRFANRVLEVISSLHGGKDKHLQKGLYLNTHWNFDDIVSEKLNSDPSFCAQDPKTLEYLNEKVKTFPPIQWRLDYENEKPKKVFYKPDWEGYLSRKNVWDESYLGAYGVVDSPEQLLSLYDFEADPRKFVISFVEIRRENQSPDGGWRYHKWGEYYGTQNPENEYLYDDKHIDKVYTYHIYEVE